MAYRGRRTPGKGGGRSTPPRLTRQEKGKAKVGDDDDDERQQRLPINLTAEDDNNQQSDDPGDDYCLSRTLSASEVGGGTLDPILLLDDEEAFDLTGLAAFLVDDTIVSSKTLRVYDEGYMRYELRLSPFISNKASVRYSISGQWAELVADNNLEVGDRILFYSLVENEDASEWYNYKIQFIRKKSKLPKVKDKVYKRTSEEEKCPDGIMRPGPGSRSISNERSIFSKGLASFEVVHDNGKPRLFLDGQVAVKIFGCPDIDTKYSVGKLRENLVVFDAGNRKYDMLLSNFRTGDGDVIYVVDAGWQRFVKIHTLTAGDCIYVYRIMDNNVHDKPYYVIRYVRNNIPSWRGATEVGLSGSRAGPSGSGTGPSGSGVGPNGSGSGPNGLSGSGVGCTGVGGTGVYPSGRGRVVEVVEDDVLDFPETVWDHIISLKFMNWATASLVCKSWRNIVKRLREINDKNYNIRSTKCLEEKIARRLIKRMLPNEGVTPAYSRLLDNESLQSELFYKLSMKFFQLRRSVVGRRSVAVWDRAALENLLQDPNYPRSM